MANEQNLIPAKPGEVRNKKGRGKGTKNWKTLFEKYLKQKYNPSKIGDKGISMPTEELQNKKLPAQDIIAIRFITKAMLKADKGDIELLANRTDGLLTQKMKVSGGFKTSDIVIPEGLTEDQYKEMFKKMQEEIKNDK